MMMRLAVTSLLLTSSHALDAILESISCDDSLPIAVVPSTFEITCNDRERCSLSRGDTALIRGHFVFNNIEEAGVQDSTAYLRAHVETVISDYALVNDGYPIDLCEAGGGKVGESGDEEEQQDDHAYDDTVYNTAYDNYNYAKDDDATDDDGTEAYAYNVDDAYFHVDDAYFDTYQVSDAEECPQNGVYEFEYEFDVPSLGRMWRATGWKAYGDVKLASGGELLGSCQLNFETKAFGVSSKAFFGLFVSVMGVTLFVGVLLAIRRGGGFLDTDDSNYFHWLGDDVIDWCGGCSLTKLSRKKKNKKDLESTFDSDSTPSSYSEKADTSLDTSLETPNTSSAGPIRVRDILPPPPPSPLPTEMKEESKDLESAFQYGLHENPPSPIRSADPPSDFPTPARDNSVRYSTTKSFRKDDSSESYCF